VSQQQLETLTATSISAVLRGRSSKGTGQREHERQQLPVFGQQRHNYMPPIRLFTATVQAQQLHSLT